MTQHCFLGFEPISQEWRPRIQRPVTVDEETLAEGSAMVIMVEEAALSVIPTMMPHATPAVALAIILAANAVSRKVFNRAVTLVVAIGSAVPEATTVVLSFLAEWTAGRWLWRSGGQRGGNGGGRGGRNRHSDCRYGRGFSLERRITIRDPPVGEPHMPSFDGTLADMQWLASHTPAGTDPSQIVSYNGPSPIDYYGLGRYYPSYGDRPAQMLPSIEAPGDRSTRQDPVQTQTKKS
ncbi:Uu.00g034830.m01.CDS01 [Anthostomella pinea]|uniref:Uu.00g034830.m01.CDS01 n=1 Tax=Anthostomella pinea TaxID=933095 RepID=A0AAI8V945_9PEZI|nr:Uu.00g034830.m01.CDS01 [Anthostomella pinea]